LRRREEKKENEAKEETEKSKYKFQRVLALSTCAESELSQYKAIHQTSSDDSTMI
jgi:hypothetical protein